MNHTSQNRHCNAPVSVEEINAFIDDELIHEDRQRVREQIKKNPELAQLVCDIDQIQDWMKEAYDTVPEMKHPQGKGRIHAVLPGALAAMMLLSVGILVGWFAGKVSSTDNGSAHAATLLQANGYSQNIAYTGTPTASARNVILRLGSDSPQKFRQTLATVEHLMKDSAHQPGFQLEVLANSDGIDFLRTGTSPYAKQIEALIEKYPNLHFMVCGTSLRNIEKEGKKVSLLPHVNITSSAVEQVAKRLREGWRYSAI